MSIYVIFVTLFVCIPAKEDCLNYLTNNYENIEEDGLSYQEISKNAESGLLWMKNRMLSQYFLHHDIMFFIDFIHVAYPCLVTIETAGTTYEGRRIPLVMLSTDTTELKRIKPVIFIECGMHAREWLATATCLYLIVHALLNPSLLEKTDWHIIPSANPDGYEYSRLNDTTWRKNRRPNDKNKDCPGVDGNRNFDIEFGKTDTSTNPCSELYGGPAPFSEAETQAIRNATTKVMDRLHAYISVHSYGPFFLVPYGFARIEAPNFSEMFKCALVAKKVLQGTCKTKVRAGNTVSILYASSGGSDDWAVAKLNASFAYTIELIQSGDTGFNFPEEDLSDGIPKVLPSLLALIACTESK